MGSYTDFFEKQAAEIFETEDYIEECRRILHQFRSFDQGLDAFIVEHGYVGKTEDVDEKVHFVADRCRLADVPVPRNLKSFFMGEKRMKRESAVPFQLCFAFGLSLEEVNDFLRRICLSRGLDCHSVREAVYYYAFKKGLSYKKTQEILAQTDWENDRVLHLHIGELAQWLFGYRVPEAVKRYAGAEQIDVLKQIFLDEIV